MSFAVLQVHGISSSLQAAASGPVGAGHASGSAADGCTSSGEHGALRSPPPAHLAISRWRWLCVIGAAISWALRTATRAPDVTPAMNRRVADRPTGLGADSHLSENRGMGLRPSACGEL